MQVATSSRSPTVAEKQRAFLVELEESKMTTTGPLTLVDKRVLVFMWRLVAHRSWTVLALSLAPSAVAQTNVCGSGVSKFLVPDYVVGPAKSPPAQRRHAAARHSAALITEGRFATFLCTTPQP